MSMLHEDSQFEVDEETLLLPNSKREKPPTPLPKSQIAILLLLQGCEPITSQSIYPYINQLIGGLDIIGGDEKKVGYYAGIIESLFFLTEASTVLHWSRASDHLGRKPVLLIGLFGICVSILCFGLSRTFWGLVISRCLCGMLNGNIGVMKSMMGELTDDTNRAEGFALIPVTWALGATIGPLIGGSLSRPHDRFPNTFGAAFWADFPYFLPCLVCASLVSIGFIVSLIFLKETVHPRREPKRRVSVPSADSGSADLAVPVAIPDREAPVSLRGLLIFPVLISISNYVFLAFLDIARSALFPLFFAMPVEIGGLGLLPPTIGYILGAYGFSSGLFQVRYFARIVRRFGPKRVFCAGMISFLPIFALFPTMSTIARRFGSSPVIWGLLVIQLALSVVMDMSYGCIFIYITTSAPNKRSLGSTNGLAQTTVAFARAVGPALSNSLFSYSVEHNILGGYAVYAFFFAASALSLFLAVRLPQEAWKNDDE